MKKNKIAVLERRRYVRLETVFPVEFRIISRETGEDISGLQQGFTRNIGRGGMCLEVNEVEDGLAKKIHSPDSDLMVYINMPHKEQPITARARIRWDKKITDNYPNKYLFGIEYVEIDDLTRKLILGYARQRRRRPKIIAATILFLAMACGLLIWQINAVVIKKGLTEKQLHKIGQLLEKSHNNRIALESRIYVLNVNARSLDKELEKGKEIINKLEDRLSLIFMAQGQEDEQTAAGKAVLEKELSLWRDENSLLKNKLQKLISSRKSLQNELEKLKDYSSANIVRVRLTNGNSLIGQLLDIAGNRINLKIGLGSIGIDNSMIRNIGEVSDREKIDISKEWKRQEKDARREEAEHNELIKKQRARGLVYFNGKWIKKDQAKKIQEEFKRREQEVFELIARQRTSAAGEEKKKELPERLIKSEKIPIISIKNRRIYVDGKLFFIKGVAYGIEYPKTSGGMNTYKELPLSLFEKDFKMIREAGINTIRTYEPLPPALLNLAEKYQLMVIENICYPSDNTDFSSQVHLNILKQQVRKYVARDKKRNCILMWSIWNDAPWAWGSGGNVVDRYGFEKVNDFLKELYITVKKYDITHPVTGSNVPEISGGQVGWDFLDVIGLNIYLGGFDWFVEEEAQRQIKEIKVIEEKYQKPVVILETGFSTYIQDQDQGQVLEKQITMAGTNFAGITIFQWADGWQKAGDKDKQDDHIEEHWGIVDGYRNPKAGYGIVSRLFEGIPTDSHGYEDSEH